MKKFLTTTITLLIATFTACAAQDFYSQWKTDYDAALAEARANDKLVFIEFADTYVCPHCVHFREEVLSKEVFKAFAEEKLVRLLIDNPRKAKLPPELREQNRKLWKEYHVRGTPTIVVLDPSGNEIFRNVGYSGASAERVVDSLRDLYRNEFTPSKSD